MGDEAVRSVFSKYPSDIQIKLKNPAGGYVYVPFTGTSYDVTKEMTAEHYSGSRFASNLTEGNIDYKGTLETGWLVDGLPADWEELGYTMTDAKRWEWLLYGFLINPFEQGSSVPFAIEYHERVYTGYIVPGSGAPQVVGGEIWAMFMGCKLQQHSMSSSQGSLAKRSYNWMAKKAKWGDHAEQ
ncbi:MAG: hypothetical protein ACYDG4_15090 [Desulfuromonadaceae bacterium]